MTSQKTKTLYWILSIFFIVGMFYSFEINYTTYDFNIGEINKKINIYFIYIIIATIFYAKYFIKSFYSKETYIIFLVSTLTLSRQIPLFIHYIILVSVLIFVFILNIKKINFFYYISKKTAFYFFLFLVIQLISTFINGFNLVSVKSIIQQFIFLFIIYTIYISLGRIKFSSKVFYPGYIIGVIICLDYTFQIFLDIFLKNNVTLFQRGDLLFYNSPTAIGLSLSLCIFLIFLKLVTEKIKIYDIICLMYFLLILFFCGSRESLLFIFLIFLFIIFHKKWYLNSFFFFTVITSTIFIIIFKDFFIESLRINNLLSGRELIWALSIQLIASNYFFGIGPDLYSTKLVSNYGNTWDLRGAISGNGSHNIFLDLLLSGGILLLFLFLIMSFYYIKKIKSINNNYSIYVKYFFLSYLIVAQFGSRGLIGGGLGEGILIWYILILGISENEIFNTKSS